jgi:hypothetical protein
MAHPRYTREEIAARARALYEQRIRDQVEAGNRGKFLVIDVDTGDYELDEDHIAASKRAYDRNPGGARYAIRIGSPTVGRIRVLV